MSVEIVICLGALCDNSAHELGSQNNKVGASLVFEGVVRVEEEGRTLVALDYEVYEPMTSRALTTLAHDILAKHALHSIRVEHSRGRVLIGQRSFRLSIQSAHRKEALSAADEFIDRMKRDVPIWKTAIFS